MKSYDGQKCTFQLLNIAPSSAQAFYNFFLYNCKILIMPIPYIVNNLVVLLKLNYVLSS